MSIDLQKADHIATITINNPERLNALDSQHLRDLAQMLRGVADDRSVRVVVLTGAGERTFVAGANIAEMRDKSSAEAAEFAQLGHAAANALENLPQPVLCAVNGFALGGGCELALACDIRIASTNAVFAQPEVVLGIPPGWGGSQRLPRVVGPGFAAEMILTGRRVGAEKALRVGLINAVHAPEDLLEQAYAMARLISANSPRAVQTSRKLLHAALRDEYQSGLNQEAESFAQAFDHPDQREGMSAFLEKRPATFED